MKTHIWVWSEIGHTPLTHRGGWYCDELRNEFVDCDNPTEAAAVARQMLRETPHAVKAAYEMPEFWNQNMRSGWVNLLDVKREDAVVLKLIEAKLTTGAHNALIESGASAVRPTYIAVLVEADRRAGAGDIFRYHVEAAAAACGLTRRGQS